jgi:hypothetical protein
LFPIAAVKRKSLSSIARIASLGSQEWKHFSSQIWLLIYSV